jgi:hypothetical protein
MDIHPLNDYQLEWLRKYFQERKDFFVVKDSAKEQNLHFCEIKEDASYRFTCKFHCSHRKKCSDERRQVNFTTYKCVIYIGPRSELK